MNTEQKIGSKEFTWSDVWRMVKAVAVAVGTLVLVVSLAYLGYLVVCGVGALVWLILEAFAPLILLAFAVGGAFCLYWFLKAFEPTPQRIKKVIIIKE